MRALVRRGDSVSLDSLRPEPALDEGFALVKPSAAALNMLDVAVARGAGPDPAFEGVLGHQVVGTITETPRGERRFASGDRVVANPGFACGRCDMCRGGLANHCREGATLGVRSLDGCVAELVRVPIQCVIRTPESLSEEAALASCALAAALQIVQAVHIETKPYVTVLGDNLVGLFAAQVMSARNTAVRLLGASERALSLCEKWGLKHRPLHEAGRRADQDVVVDCVGTPESFNTCVRLVRPRGRIVLKAAFSMPGETTPRRDLLSIVENEIEIIGSRSGSLPEALSILERGEVQHDGLFSRRLTLDDATEALAAAADPAQTGVLVKV